MAVVKVFTSSEPLRKLFARTVITLYALVITSIALADGDIVENSPVIPILAHGVNLNDLPVCMIGFSQQNCQQNDACTTHYFDTTPSCTQVAAVYHFAHAFPIAAKVYTNITVLKMSDNSFLLIDYFGKVIKPLADVNLDSIPGLLNLADKSLSPRLTGKVLDFPAAIYLSTSTNQLLLLQSVVDSTCQANCPQIAVAKVLYGFTIEGKFANVRVLRIME